MMKIALERRAQLVGPDRLVGRQGGHAACARHVDEHAAGDDRRDGAGVALEQPEVAHALGARRAAVEVVVLAARDVGQRVDVGARVDGPSSISLCHPKHTRLSDS
jgi:hypothetical protein